MALQMQHIAIGFAQRVLHDLVAHETAVHKEILRIAAGLAHGRRAGQPPQAQAAKAFIDGNRMLSEFIPEDRGSAFGQIAAQPARRGAAIVGQRELHAWVGQRHAPNHVIAMRIFGAFGFEEFAPRRGLEIQIVHFNGCTGRKRRRNGIVQNPVIGLDPPSVRSGFEAAGERQTRNRGDAGQSFATKTERRHPAQIVKIADFAGGVPVQRQRQIVLFDAAAIVDHFDEFGAARREFDLNALTAGVQAVFQQLFQGRRRAFDHFAGGDLVHKMVGKKLDAWH